MKVYVFFNKQRASKAGRIPIYLCVARPPQRLYIPTGMDCGEVFADGIFPKSERNHKAKTIMLSKHLEETEQIALNNSLLPHDELKALILDRVFGKAVLDKTLACYVREYKSLCRAENTKEKYEYTARKIEEFDKSANLNISYMWLQCFQTFLREQGLRDNSASIHFRNIRSVINWAIKNEWTTNYPFRNFSIPHEETEKRDIPLEDLRYILTADDLTTTQEKYRDIFALMFYLIGVNGIDLLNADKSQLKDGRFEYRRYKTGRLYSIKVEPEAQILIDKYAGRGEKLLRFTERSNYRSVMAKMNAQIKSLRAGITSYYARHTWATIAASIDVPYDTISEALGHSHGADVTNIYIHFDKRKIDAANRRVIDYVLGAAGS